MLGEKGKKGKGCTLKGMKSDIHKFGDKSMKPKGGSVSGGARKSNGPNGNIMGGRSDV